MSKNIKKSILFSALALLLCFGFTSTALANQSPVANAGSDLYLTSGQTATLPGSGSDIDGGVLTYSWNCTGGTLSSYNIPQPIYTAPVVIAFNNYAYYDCTLTVTDASGLSNSDPVRIYVNYNSSYNISSIDTKTESATNIQTNKATLNGSYKTTNDSISYAWFQYGFSSNYGEETTHQAMSGTSGSFTQNLSSLFLNATYHYRAVTQDSNGNKFYGQDIVFNTASSYHNTGNFDISKKVINISSGNLAWSDSLTAKPSDILSFSVTIKANTADLHNVILKDVLPANLIYNNNLLINAVRDSSKNPIDGINLGTIKAGDVAIISYQVKVSPATSFTFGNTNLSASTTLSSDEVGQQTRATQITIYNSQVSGITTTSLTPTALPTGLTNNLFTESLLLPMLLIIAGGWFYSSGRVYQFADWIQKKIKK